MEACSLTSSRKSRFCRKWSSLLSSLNASHLMLLLLPRPRSRLQCHRWAWRGFLSSGFLPWFYKPTGCKAILQARHPSRCPTGLWWSWAVSNSSPLSVHSPRDALGRRIGSWCQGLNRSPWNLDCRTTAHCLILWSLGSQICKLHSSIQIFEFLLQWLLLGPLLQPTSWSNQ